MRTNKNQRFVFALSTILLCLLASCQDQVTDVTLSYYVIIEDHSTSYSFPRGVYYSFVFPQPYTYEFDVDVVLRRVANTGTRLRDAWYKSFNSACAPPGSNLVLPAIVDPVLIVRVESSAPALEQLGFVQTQNPNTGFCNYTVYHYIFLN